MELNSFQVETPEEKASRDGRRGMEVSTSGNNVLTKNKTGNNPNCAFVSSFAMVLPYSDQRPKPSSFQAEALPPLASGNLRASTAPFSIADNLISLSANPFRLLKTQLS